MINKIKNIKSTDIVYISILLVLFLIVVIVFFISAKSITKNVNKIFIQSENSSIQVLDREKYTLLEKKLNLKQTKESPSTGTQEVKAKTN